MPSKVVCGYKTNKTSVIDGLKWIKEKEKKKQSNTQSCCFLEARLRGRLIIT